MESEFTKFKKEMYKSYVQNMKVFGKPVLKYLAWLKEVSEIKIDHNHPHNY